MISLVEWLIQIPLLIQVIGIPLLVSLWHGNTNENSQLWIGFAGGAYSPYSAGICTSRINSKWYVELPTGILTAYNDNAWHHVAVTRNGSTASIYVDGALRSTASISGSLNTSYGSYEAFIGFMIMVVVDLMGFTKDMLVISASTKE